MKLAHTLEFVKALGVLRSAGVSDPKKPLETLRTMKESKILGPQATLIRHSARVARTRPVSPTRRAP